MKSTLQRIEEIKRNGYRLDLGEVINDTFSTYKQTALLSGAVLLVVALAAMILIGGGTAMFLGVTEFTESMTELGASGVLNSTALIIRLLGSMIFYGLVAPVGAGLIQMAHNASVNEEFDFGTAFMHYKSVYFKELFLGTVLITLIATGITTVIDFLRLSDPLGIAFIVLNIAGGLISGLIQLFSILMVPLIIFGNLNAFDAIKGSFVLVYKRFWMILLLVIMFGIFSALGFFALCIGILFTYPIIYAMQYCIYKAALPIEEVNELDEIGKNYF